MRMLFRMAPAILAALIACEGPGTVHVSRYPSGQVKETWTERREEGGPSLRDGTFKSFHPDGSPESEIPYRRGKRHGTAFMRLPGGALVFEGEYRDDFLVRERRSDPAGNPTVEREYAVRAFPARALGPDGDSIEVLEACAYLEEPSGPTRHGLCRMTYKEGGAMSDRHYRRGRLHGPVKAWYPGGARWMEGAYEDGLPSGAWTTWSPEGKTAWSASFARGERTGAWKEFYPDGRPKSRHAYRAGKPDGPYQEWYPNGKPRLRGGRRLGRREGQETAWYPDGSRLYEARFAGGRLEGEFMQWHPDGRPRMQCRFSGGRKHGACRQWHRQGGLMELSTWRNGRLDGPWKSFAPNGRLLVSKEYRGGELAFDSKARELLELLGAGDAGVPVGAFGLYWGMTPTEARGALSILRASGIRQERDDMVARARLFAGGDSRTARLRIRFNAQGELWEIGAEIDARRAGDLFPLWERFEEEIGAEMGRPRMRRSAGAADFDVARSREWGRFSVTIGEEIPVRRDIPVVTAEGWCPGGEGSFRFTLANHLFREYVNTANAAVTPPEWPEAAFLARH
jgi:antitoxin component YwqK of YwqJK toxin-antitoxin module